MTGPTVVRVHPPSVRGATVSFSWSQSPANALQHRDRWSVRTDGIALGRVDRRLWYDVLLSLQLPLWAAAGPVVRVELPEPVGAVTVDFWRTYHGAEHVEFTGTDDTRRYDAAAGLRGPASRRTSPSRPLAVTFGGGKDSTLAYEALLETRPVEDVLLLHMVQHFSNVRRTHAQDRWRSTRTVLGPVRRRLPQAPVQVVSTDYMASLRKDRHGPRPHVHLYLGGMLPAMLHHGVGEVVFSRTAAGYGVDRDDTGRVTHRGTSGRPERLDFLRRYYADVLGHDLHSESTHYAIGEFTSYRALLHSYPGAFADMVMCMRTRRGRRFCVGCAKCLEFALFGLASGQHTAGLDVDAVLLHPRVRAIADRARQGAGTRAWHGAAPYDSLLGTASHFAAWCHALHLIDPADPTLPLRTSEARGVLADLRAAWGRPFPASLSLDPEAIAAAGPLGREVAAVAARNHPVVARVPGDPDSLLLRRDRQVHFAHDVPLPTPDLDAWAERWQVPPAGDGADLGLRSAADGA